MTLYFMKNSSANFNLTILDCTYVTIGNNCLFGPDCKIIAVTHSLVEREFEKELTQPVKVNIIPVFSCIFCLFIFIL